MMGPPQESSILYAATPERLRFARSAMIAKAMKWIIDIWSDFFDDFTEFLPDLVIESRISAFGIA